MSWECKTWWSSSVNVVCRSGLADWPFGHSKEQASLLHKCNSTRFSFTVRLSGPETAASGKRLEFVWKSNENLGRKADLLPLFGQSLLSPKALFRHNKVLRWAFHRRPKLGGLQHWPKVDEFIKWTEKYAAMYTSNQVLFTMETTCISSRGTVF